MVDAGSLGVRLLPSEGTSEICCRGHTLILPGNGGLAMLGELCVDALISTLGLRRVGHVESSHLLPVAMGDAWNPTSKESVVTTCAEVFQSVEMPTLTVFQLRSPTIEGHRRAFANELVIWAINAEVREFVVVSGCSAHVRSDVDLQAPCPLRHTQLGSALPAFNGAEVLPLSLGFPEAADPRSQELEAIATKLRGSGTARLLLEVLAEKSHVAACPTAVGIFAFTAETLEMPLLEKMTTAMLAFASGLTATPQRKLSIPPSWGFIAAAQLH